MLEEKKAEVTSFERGMESKVMSIGNEIASLTIECDKVDALKSALVNDDEETSAKKQDQISELSQVIFAIDNIESLCSRKTEWHETHLPYAKGSKHQENFDTLAQCEDIAKEQLDHIGNYMKDFKAILTGFDFTKVKKPDIRNAPNAAAVQEDSDEDD